MLEYMFIKQCDLAHIKLKTLWDRVLQFIVQIIEFYTLTI